MELNFFKPEELLSKIKEVKATIHKTGRLGFSSEAVNKLNLSENRHIKIANSNDSKNCLYVVLYSEKQETTFHVKVKNSCYYIEARKLFNKLEINYEDETVIFDITDTEDKFDGKPIYKLTMRTAPKRRTWRD